MSQQPFKNLPPEHLRPGYLAQFNEIDPKEESVLMNKIGGSKPFLYTGEKWPKDMTFVCQFKHPVEKKYVRLFMNLNDLDEYQFDIIDFNQPYQFNPISPVGLTPLKCHKLVSWKKIKELNDIESLYFYYQNHIDQFKLEFGQQLKEDYELTEIAPEKFMETIFYSVIQEEYMYSDKQSSKATLKIGGTPYSELDLTQTYIENGTLFQLCKTEQLDVPFIVGHLMIDDLNFISEIPDEEEEKFD